MATLKRALNVSDVSARVIRKFHRLSQTGWWEGTKSKSGYGRVTLIRNGDHSRYDCNAHILAYAIYFGGVPAGKLIRHKCDVLHTEETGNKLAYKLCVRKDHLELGKDYDNVHDSIDRGRAFNIGEEVDNSGENHRDVILTWGKVRKIRRLYAEGSASYRELAKRFKVSAAAINGVISGRKWKDPSYARPVREFKNKIRLTWEDVKEIRRQHAVGISQQEIANTFGVNQGYISGIVLLKHWKHGPQKIITTITKQEEGEISSA